MLKLSLPSVNKKSVPLEFIPATESDTELLEMVVPFNCEVSGKQIVEMNFPPESKIVLIYRNDRSIIPEGTTIIESGDVFMILVNRKSIDIIKNIFS